MVNSYIINIQHDGHYTILADAILENTLKGNLCLSLEIHLNGICVSKTNQYVYSTNTKSAINISHIISAKNGDVVSLVASPKDQVRLSDVTFLATYINPLKHSIGCTGATGSVGVRGMPGIMLPENPSYMDYADAILKCGLRYDDHYYYLQLAIRNNHFDIFKTLVKNFEMNLQGSNYIEIGSSKPQYNNLITAVQCKNIKFIDYLLDNGVDINYTSDGGFNALYYAATENNDTEIFKHLLERGADFGLTFTIPIFDNIKNVAFYERFYKLWLLNKSL